MLAFKIDKLDSLDEAAISKQTVIKIMNSCDECSRLANAQCTCTMNYYCKRHLSNHLQLKQDHELQYCSRKIKLESYNFIQKRKALKSKKKSSLQSIRP